MYERIPMNLDFLEIGTCNFNTLIQKATDNDFGISVEPLLYYLNQLPSPKNVIKENVAISFDNTEGEASFFYIPEEIILAKNLDKSLRGCNSINNYHVKHIEDNLQEFVKCEKVKQIPIANLLQKYKVVEIDYLKIDTEGGDTYILDHLYNYLQDKDLKYYPKKICFESNRLTPKERIDYIIKIYTNRNYNLVKRKHDTILVLKDY